MSPTKERPQNWWWPKQGQGQWKVQITPERPDFGLCINVASGERKSWEFLKEQLYGQPWLEVVTEALEAGRARRSK